MRRISFHVNEATLAEYALGGLGQAEHDEVDQHLAGCARCDAALADVSDAFALLADEVAPLAPRPGLKSRLFGSLDAAFAGGRS